MPQALSKYISKEYQVKVEVAAPTGTFAIGDVVANNAAIGSATFYGLVKKVGGTGATTYLMLEPFAPLTVNGTVYESTAIVADAATLYGYVQSSGASTGASAVVDTVTGADGADVLLTAKGIERVRNIGGRIVSEVLVAVRDFATKQAV